MKDTDHKARVVKWVDFHTSGFCNYCGIINKDVLYINTPHENVVIICHGCFDAIVELVKEKRG